jgi:hypothetical protein
MVAGLQAPDVVTITRLARARALSGQFYQTYQSEGATPSTQQAVRIGQTSAWAAMGRNLILVLPRKC